MTQSKHTQAPWSAWYDEELDAWQIDDGGMVFCTLDQSDCSQEQAKANARLIAAAPELLEALEALRDRALKDADAQGLDDNAPIYAFIQDATDVILKAKGES